MTARDLFNRIRDAYEADKYGKFELRTETQTYTFPMNEVSIFAIFPAKFHPDYLCIDYRDTRVEIDATKVIVIKWWLKS